jgi:endonuclease YncB( thermonuclease family)
MPLTLIKGEYRIVNAAPDGDSIRFYPNDPDLWRKLDRRVRTNREGGAQLRLEAIDTLETHYQPKNGGLGTLTQPIEAGREAASELLKFLGFTKVTRGAREMVTASTPKAVEGFILSRSADVNGRGVAFAFKGNTTEAEDGAALFLDKALLNDSANYHLLQTGLAYPTFYSKLYIDLRKELTKVAQKAREKEKGIWASDRTTEGFELERLETITEDVVILPKLFRRLADYLALNDGSPDLGGFKRYVESLDDRVIVLPEGQITGFDTVIEVNDQSVNLTVQPEFLVFMEK